ncbi:MAG: NTF2 enzyme family protein [Planctomycetota bacterium]|nr:MAG: NTF2 enzyme family protein [Planctomycetota bacterium]
MSKTPPPLREDVPLVVQLADAQLRAYNARDIDAFCACFHDQVIVLDADGQRNMEGIESFRERYAVLFGFADVRADIVGRVVHPPHLIEHELYSRKRTDDDAAESGAVLVRYTEREGKLAVVQFWS